MGGSLSVTLAGVRPRREEPGILRPSGGAVPLDSTLAPGLAGCGLEGLARSRVPGIRPAGWDVFLSDSIVEGPEKWDRCGRFIFIGTVTSTCMGLLAHC